MSTDRIDHLRSGKDSKEDVWRQLAEHRDALEMCVEEEVPFADRAEKLLDRLEEEGY